MIRLLSGLSPGLLLLVGAIPSALAAGTAGWFLRGAVFDHVERPAIIRHQVEICTERTERVAAEAVAIEQLRQFRAGEMAAEQFIRDAQAAAEDRQAERDALETEIDRYVEQLAEAGDRAHCTLNPDDLDLLGLRPPAGSDGQGGTDIRAR